MEPTGPLRAPDPLLYWSASPAQGALPSDARLLGPLSAAPVQRFPLPAERGQLIVYSLGHAEIVAQGPLPSGAP